MSSISKAHSNSTEESGWTTYFDDFFNSNHIDDNDDDNHDKCSLSTSSSLLSDATSLVDKNVLLSHDEHVEIDKEFSLNKNVKKGSCLKKRKSIVDQTLEDTATSPPLNIPKVCMRASSVTGRKYRRTEVVNSQEKGNSSGQKELSLNEKDSDCTELKRRGLCIVPL